MSKSNVVVTVNADGTFEVRGPKGKEYIVTQVLRPPVAVPVVPAPVITPEPAVGTAIVCEIKDCGAELTPRNLAYIADHPYWFNGRALCFKHQQLVKKTKSCKVCNRVLSKKELDYVGIHMAGEMLCVLHQKHVDPSKMICADCGVVVDRRVHDYSVKFYGKVLCRDHQAKNTPQSQRTDVVVKSEAPAKQEAAADGVVLAAMEEIDDLSKAPF